MTSLVQKMTAGFVRVGQLLYSLQDQINGKQTKLPTNGLDGQFLAPDFTFKTPAGGGGGSTPKIYQYNPADYQTIEAIDLEYSSPAINLNNTVITVNGIPNVLSETFPYPYISMKTNKLPTSGYIDFAESLIPDVVMLALLPSNIDAGDFIAAMFSGGSPDIENFILLMSGIVGTTPVMQCLVTVDGVQQYRDINATSNNIRLDFSNTAGFVSIINDGINFYDIPINTEITRLHLLILPDIFGATSEIITGGEVLNYNLDGISLSLPEGIEDGDYLYIQENTNLLGYSLNKEDYLQLIDNKTAGIITRVPEEVVFPKGRFRGSWGNQTEFTDWREGDYYVKPEYTNNILTFSLQIYSYNIFDGSTTLAWRTIASPSSTAPNPLPVTYDALRNTLLNANGELLAGYLGVRYEGENANYPNPPNQNSFYLTTQKPLGELDNPVTGIKCWAGGSWLDIHLKSSSTIDKTVNPVELYEARDLATIGGVVRYLDHRLANQPVRDPFEFVNALYHYNYAPRTFYYEAKPTDIIMPVGVNSPIINNDNCFFQKGVTGDLKAVLSGGVIEYSQANITVLFTDSVFSEIFNPYETPELIVSNNWGFKLYPDTSRGNIMCIEFGRYTDGVWGRFIDGYASFCDEEGNNFLLGTWGGFVRSTLLGYINLSISAPIDSQQSGFNISLAGYNGLEFNTHIPHYANGEYLSLGNLMMFSNGVVGNILLRKLFRSQRV